MIAPPQAFEILEEATRAPHLELDFAIRHEWAQSGWLDTVPYLTAEADVPSFVEKGLPHELTELLDRSLALDATERPTAAALAAAFARARSVARPRLDAGDALAAGSVAKGDEAADGAPRRRAGQ